MANAMTSRIGSCSFCWLYLRGEALTPKSQPKNGFLPAGRAPKAWRLMVFSQGSRIPQEMNMAQIDRITQDPGVMGGKPCIRGMRVTVGMIVGQIGAGHSIEEVLADYPYLEREDVLQALRYAAWLAEEREVPLPRA